MGKEIVRLGGILCIITLIVTLMLSCVNMLTKDTIAANTLRAENEARSQIIPADTFNDIGDGVFEAVKNNETVGYCVSVEASGFGGSISMIVGVNTDESIAGIRIITHSETAGLGARAAEPDFINKFTGKLFPLSVTKNASAGDSEISAISGATITSDAVVSGVNSAVQILKERGVL